MKHRALPATAVPLAAVLATLLGSSAAAGQSICDRPKLEVGDRWRYQVKDRRGTDRQQVFEVLAVSDTEVRQKSVGASELESVFTPDHNFVRNSEGLSNAPHSASYDFPMTPGKSWPVRFQWTNGNAQGDFEGERKVEASEKVTVPAGTFEACRISSRGRFINRATGNASDMRSVDWYAPAARAMVRRERTMASRGSFTEDSTWELIELTVKGGK